MPIIEKRTIYQLELTASLKIHQQFFKEGQGEFSDKALCDLYRALQSFALEIGRAIGKIETEPMLPVIITPKTAGLSKCGKLRTPVLNCINNSDKAMTAQEIMYDLAYKDCALNRTRLEKALKELASERKIDAIIKQGEVPRFIRKQDQILVA